MLLSEESTKTADSHNFTAAASHQNEIILMSCAVFMPKFPKCSDYDRIEGFFCISFLSEQHRAAVTIPVSGSG